MATLTHPAFPLPIWDALQICNRLVQHRRLDTELVFDLETSFAGAHVVEKGIEVDCHARLMRGSRCDWESTITYYYRGWFGGETASAPAPAAPDLSDAAVVDRLRMPVGGGWAFGKLTGDYNGIHNWDAYARRFGFRSALMHPQSSGLVYGAPSKAAFGPADA